MRVFADHHHQALFNSLQMLFEDRLGWELYRPIGTDWFTAGYWMVYNHPATVEQFLGLQQGVKKVPDGWVDDDYVPLNKDARLCGDIYYINDPSHGREHKAITLDVFKDTKFDIIISSIPQHIDRFNKLIAECQPQAKHIFQVGNAWGHQAGVKNILASTAPFSTPPNINVCFYHQEFDLNVFRYEPPTKIGIVNSYVHYMQGTHTMANVARYLPSWRFKTYGAGMQDSLPSAMAVGEAMRDSSWTWHFKPEGDGYGHSIISSFACGRPAIIWSDQYQGKLAGSLFINGKTCIDARGKTPEEIATVLALMSPPAKHLKMCEAAHKRFKEVVDFSADEVRIRKFLEDLK